MRKYWGKCLWNWDVHNPIRTHVFYLHRRAMSREDEMKINSVTSTQIKYTHTRSPTNEEIGKNCFVLCSHIDFKQTQIFGYIFCWLNENYQQNSSSQYLIGERKRKTKSKNANTSKGSNNNKIRTSPSHSVSFTAYMNRILLDVYYIYCLPI